MPPREARHSRWASPGCGVLLLSYVLAACGGQAADGADPDGPPIGSNGGTDTGGGGVGGTRGPGGSGGQGAGGSSGTTAGTSSGGSDVAMGGSSSGGAMGGDAGAGAGGMPSECGAALLLTGDISQFLGSIEGDENRFDACPGEGPEAVLQWTPPAPGRYVIDTFGSQFDTVLYAGTELPCTGEAPINSCNDDFDGIQSLLAVDVGPGRDVFVVVDSYNSSTGEYVLNFRGLADCPSSDLGGALGSPSYAAPDFAPEAGLLAESGISECGGAAVGVTFSWEAPATGTYRFFTDGSDFDAVLALRDGCAGSLLICDDDSGNEEGAAVVERSFQAGERVLIELGPFRRPSSREPLGGAMLNIEAL